MDSKELKEFIKFVSKLDVNEISLDIGDIKLKIKNGSGEQNTPISAIPQQIIAAAPPAAPAPPVTTPESNSEATQPPIPAAPATENNNNHVEIKSPMIGTVYLKASPEKPPFLKVGDTVNIGDPVCSIEAMKLFNEIESEVSGKVVKILVDDSSPVEYGQPLFLIDPS